MGAQKNCLIETALLSTHNIRFGYEIRKIMFKYTLIWRPANAIQYRNHILHSIDRQTLLENQKLRKANKVCAPHLCKFVSAFVICKLLSKLTCQKLLSDRNTIILSTGLDPDHSVGPNLGPNCLQMFISRQRKSPLARKELK